MKVCIIGLGLIGGSLARDLSAKGHTVFGADRSRSTLRKARRAGAIAQSLGPSLEGIEDADLCVLALPVDAAQRTLRLHAARLANLPAITDVGSTKLSIQRAAAAARLRNFVGSHPMAGGEKSGWAAARDGLFKGQRVYLCAPRGANASAVKLVRRLWRAVGGRLETIDAAEHDAHLAATSHLPQVVALALAMLYADARIGRDQLGRGGREMTRLAASSGEMWSAIFTDHSKNVNARIWRLRQALTQLERAIEKRDAPAIRRLMRLTNAWARR